MIRIALSMLVALVAFASLPVQAQRTPFSGFNGLWLDPLLPDRVMVFSPSPGAREIELPIGRIVLRPAPDKHEGEFTMAVSGVLCTYAVNPSDGTMSYKLSGHHRLFRPNVTVGRRMTWQILEGAAPCQHLVQLVRVDAHLSETHHAWAEECDRLAADPWDTTRPVGIAGVDFMSQVEGANPLAACQNAVDLTPGDARRIYQLARVLVEAERAQVGRNGRLLGLEANRLYRDAAAAGHAGAKTAVAVDMLYTIYGTKRTNADVAHAAKLLREAAEAGDIEGMHRLARLLREGHGVAQDPKGSIDWYRRAVVAATAEKGFEYSSRASGRGIWVQAILSDLGETYRLGAESPDQEVIDWFRSLAGRKIRQGVEFMEWIYREGRGAPRDSAEADRWLHIINPPVSAEERARRSAEYKSKCVDNVPRQGNIEWCRFMRGWK